MGRGSGPVEYLLGKDFQRKDATLDRGDPEMIQALIDSSPYVKKYTSGVLSFLESDLKRDTKDKLMSSFENALFPGLDADQYACLWVEHRDKGRLELNFVIPNIELQTGKRLQPYFDRADRPRINAWKVGMNAILGLHDPDDPMNKRELVTPRNLPQSKQDTARAITDGLLSLAGNGEITGRQSVVRVLEQSGFTVARQTKKSISIADPDGGRNIRLKGMIYEQDFEFGPGLREKIEAASARYRAESQQRIQEARRVYKRGIEIKREEDKRRHKRPESPNGVASTKNMVRGGSDGCHGSYDHDGGSHLARETDRRELGSNQPTEIDDQSAGGQRRENTSEYMWQAEPPLHQGRPERERLWEQSRGISMDDPRGVLKDDRIREAALKRIREFTEATRETAQRFCDSLQRFNSNVRGYVDRERVSPQPSQQLERTGRQFERIVEQIRSGSSVSIPQRKDREM